MRSVLILFSCLMFSVDRGFRFDYIFCCDFDVGW
jgi:hypothetical protein